MTNSYGKPMQLKAVGIDSRGHRTAQVTDFVLRTTFKVRVYSVQGSTSRLGRAIAQTGSYPNRTHTGKTIKHGYCVWNVGTEICKDYIFGHLAADGEREAAAQVFHFPQGLDDTYYDGLLSETYDSSTKRYVQRLGARYKRNEPLDTMVIAWAIGNHREISIGKGTAGRPSKQYWERLEVMLESGEMVAPEDVAPAAPAPVPAPVKRIAQRPQRKNFSNSWRN